MKEFIEKLISRLEEQAKLYRREEEIMQTNPCYQMGVYGFEALGFEKSINIIKKLAKEYNNGWISASRPPKIEITDDGKAGAIILHTIDGQVVIGSYINDSFYAKQGNDQRYLVKVNNDNILYWQPFPKPITISETWKQQIIDRFERVE